MSKKLLHIAMAALLAIGGFGLYNNSEVSLSEEAVAAGISGATSTACTDPTAAAFTPGIAYTLTWSAPAAAGSALTPTCSVSLSSVVNAEASTPACTAALLSSGNVIERIQTPIMKLGGLQCQTLNDGKLEVEGDGTDNLNFTIGIDNLALTDTDNIASGSEVDDNVTASKAVIFGAASSLIADTAITDGSDADSTTATNGEISFGGSVEANGGSEMKVRIDVSNYDVSATTDVETLTFTLTGS